MKRILLVSVVLFVFVAMVACSSMCTASGPRVLRARGTVLSYEPGKMVSLKPGAAEIQYTADGDYIAAPENAPKRVFDYAITPDTETVHG